MSALMAVFATCHVSLHVGPMSIMFCCMLAGVGPYVVKQSSDLANIPELGPRSEPGFYQLSSHINILGDI